MSLFKELLNHIDKSRLLPEFKAWALEELIYLEANESDIKKLLEEKKKNQKRDNKNQSTVAYLLHLTDEAPKNPISRTPTSPPDFDFDTNARDEVKAYLVKKYGHEHVTLLGTYQTLKTKGAIKDVCRALRPEGSEKGLNFEQVNEITKKFILNRNDFDSELDYFYGNIDNDQSLKKWFEQNEDIKDAVLKLLGNAKSSGIHAGGIVLSSAEVKAHCPLSYSIDEGVYITQPEMKYVEMLGLIKYDYLGLRTLNDLSRCMKLIEKRHGLKLKLSSIPLDEPDVLEEFRLGNTLSVFQFNTDLAIGILTKLDEIKSIRDLAIVTSIARRGPLQMGMDEVFIRRATGKEPVTYLHPSLESALKETLGIFTYQESVMQVGQEMGGFTGDEALTVMKAMGKKNKQVLQSFEARFLASAQKKNVNPRVAKQIWDLMESFAEYGFNKSHAIAYSAVSYLCMWFKLRFPLEWKCAVLQGADKEDFKVFYSSWKNEISKPDINDSKENYFISASNQVVMPFTSINGIGDKVVSAIIRHQPYRNFDDYLNVIIGKAKDYQSQIDLLKKQMKADPSLDHESLIDDLKVKKSEYTRAHSKAIVTSLIMAGCFDSYKNKEEHMAFYRKNLVKRYVELKHTLIKPDKKTLSEDLELVETFEKMPRKDFLFEELKLLNFTSFDYFDYFKDLIYNAARKHFKNQKGQPMECLKPEEALQKKPGEEVVIAGAIESIQFFATKTGQNKGKEMCRITLSHNNTSIEVTIFPRTLEFDDKNKRLIRSQKELYPFMVYGKLNEWNGKLSVIYEKGLSLI